MQHKWANMLLTGNRRIGRQSAFVLEFPFDITLGAELKDGNHKTWSKEVNQMSLTFIWMDEMHLKFFPYSNIMIMIVMSVGIKSYLTLTLIRM